MIQLWIITQALCLITTHIKGLQFMGRAVSFDWHFRSQLLPPFRETLDLEQKLASKQNDDRLEFRFAAFGKRWHVDVQKNNMLFTKGASKITTRSSDGRILRRHNKVRSDCYYVGTARGDESEYGMVSLSTCNGDVHGLITTNANDYVIFEKGWKKSRRKRAAHEAVLDLSVAPTSEFEKHSETLANRSSMFGKREKRFTPEDIQVPKFYKLDAPSGRNVFVELGIIVDQYYSDDFKLQISKSTQSLLHHILLAFNNAQLWYLNPSLGFNVWLVIKDVVLLQDELPLKSSNSLSNPATLCNWVKDTFRENNTWDEVLILSSQPNIWQGRVGLAQRAGVCSSHGNDRCAGVSHVNFQMASFARLIAHEGMHPLGVNDDYEGRNSRLCYSGVMRRGVWQDHDWSVCAVQSFERWLSAKGSKCVSKEETPTIQDKTPTAIPVNVGWRSMVVQSSTYKSEEEWGAWKATDGPVTGLPQTKNAVHGSCTHTLREDKPWIRVDLEPKYSETQVEAVIIYNRDDCCSDRLRNFEVRIGNNSDFTENPLCFHYRGGVSGGRSGAAVITCESSLSGSYISVQLMDINVILTVCEIQIMMRVTPEYFSYTQNKCYDLDGFCPYWQAVGECHRDGQEKFMTSRCPYSCGVCQRESIRPTEQNAPYETVIHPVTSSPGLCRDSHESCLHYAANGDCGIDLETRRRCPRSCGTCNTTVLSTSAALVPSISLVGKPRRRTTTRRSEGSTSPSDRERISTTATNALRPTDSEIDRVSRKPNSQRNVTPPAFLSDTERHTQSDTAYSTCNDGNKNCEQWMELGYCTTSQVVSDLCMKSCDLCSPADKESTIQTDKESTIQTEEECPAGVLSTCAGIISEHGCNTEDEDTKQCLKVCKLCSDTNTSHTMLPSNDEVIHEPQHQTTMLALEHEVIPVTTVINSTTSKKEDNADTATASPNQRRKLPKRCRDFRSSCSNWAKNGHCKVASVQKSCPLSCELCSSTGDTTSCRDSSHNCIKWAELGHCGSKSVSRTCKKSCNRC